MNTNTFKKKNIGIVVLGLFALIGISLANAVETGKPMSAQVPQAKPMPIVGTPPQMNESQMLRMEIQQLRAQVTQLTNDVQTLRSRYNDHTHSLVGVGHVGTQIVPSLNGIILTGGGGEMKVLTVMGGNANESKRTSGPSR
jgi:hypothetical protein